ncbi:MAG: hydroxymethylglutaryl-CoA synthase [Myxococcota bacterium]
MALIGIDDIAMHIPRLFVDMRDFAALRSQDYDKLRKGLGLEAMAIPDAHEDTATMGANAVARLIDRNALDPSRIGRLYLGTESALDGSKPTATYILEMLEMRYGRGVFRHCDVVDMTFACIGAVDALHNTLDWVARGGLDQDRIGIVVFADNAKYDLGSTGEYTQGAGGGAMLIRHHPRLLAIEDRFGVSTKPVHDFFKPRRAVAVQELLSEALKLAREAGGDVSDDLVDAMMAKLGERTTERFGLFSDSPVVQVHKDTPVFDGQFSNTCYREAVKEAFVDFREQAMRDGRYDPAADPVLTEQWARILLHLPYAFQGKRMFPDVFRHERQGLAMWQAVEAEIGPAPARPGEDASEADRLEAERAIEGYRRKVSKTEAYRTFVTERIERGQRASSLIGNQYTGSLFLALMSTFESDLQDDTDLTGKRLGLCGYGSGAKAKVFEGIVQPQWRDVATQFRLFERLQSRQAIGTDLYEDLHRGHRTDSVRAPDGEFVLAGIDRGGVREGARRYAWIDGTV